MTDYPLFTFGGDGATLHTAVANGFPPQSYAPLAAHLTQNFRVVSLPPRALWQETPPEKRESWKYTVARDLSDALTAHDLHDVIAVGHSFGGVASLLAAIAAPERFRALILLDPTIMPPNTMRMIRLAQAFNLKNPLAQGAERRRESFLNRDDAYQRLRNKSLFRDWDEDAFNGYLDAMPTGADGSLKLAWPRAWEAYYFRTLYTGTWRELPKLRGKLPILALRGGNSDTFLPDAAERFRRVLPDTTVQDVAGHGHLFPQSAPEQTASMIVAWLRDKGS